MAVQEIQLTREHFHNSATDVAVPLSDMCGNLYTNINQIEKILDYTAIETSHIESPMDDATGIIIINHTEVWGTIDDDPSDPLAMYVRIGIGH